MILYEQKIKFEHKAYGIQMTLGDNTFNNKKEKSLEFEFFISKANIASLWDEVLNMTGGTDDLLIQCKKVRSFDWSNKIDQLKAINLADRTPKEMAKFLNKKYESRFTERVLSMQEPARSSILSKTDPFSIMDFGNTYKDPKEKKPYGTDIGATGFHKDLILRCKGTNSYKIKETIAVTIGVPYLNTSGTHSEEFNKIFKLRALMLANYAILVANLRLKDVRGLRSTMPIWEEKILDYMKHNGTSYDESVYLMSSRGSDLSEGLSSYGSGNSIF